MDYQGNVKALMIEDNPVNQRLATLILWGIGCQVSIANNGEESVAQARHQAFDSIFMDVELPVMGLYGYRIDPGV